MHGIEVLNIYDNPRRNPKFIFLGIIALIFGVTIDYYIFPNETLTLSYIPLMVMIGYLFRNFITTLILAGLATISLQHASLDEFSTELFFLRWMGYFLIAFIVRTLFRNNRIEQENLINFTFTLAESIDARDNYTAFHSKNVAYYSYEIGNALNLSHKECTHLYIGGLLHDIGKIGIPEGILNKPSPLTSEEFEQIKQHPQKGYEMLKHVPSFRKNSIMDMVLLHHEKFDGTGYPKGLNGKNIPLVARIMAVADSFDAMTSRRIYRNTKDLEYALNEISKGKGSQFDPEIADVFLELINERKITVRGSFK